MHIWIYLFPECSAEEILLGTYFVRYDPFQSAGSGDEDSFSHNTTNPAHGSYTFRYQ